MWQTTEGKQWGHQAIGSGKRPLGYWASINVLRQGQWAIGLSGVRNILKLHKSLFVRQQNPFGSDPSGGDLDTAMFWSIQ
jgi:hypothetical protein